MPTLLSPRDINSVENTFSSWDSCMSEGYCKWPVIVAIIIGSLLILSFVVCCARCLCCGAECCCGCLSCFNRCCPSPRRKNKGYEQPPPQYPPSRQYQSPAPPAYFGGGAGGFPSAQTATFDAPSGKYNEDALPAMPSWNAAPSRRVVEEEDDVELEKLDQHSPQRQGLLHQRQESLEHDSYHHGDIGAMATSPYNEYPSSYQDHGALGQSPPANPYHNYSQHQQQITSPTSTIAPSLYPPTYRTQAPSVYDAPPANPYGGSPPTYRTASPIIASPVPQHVRMPSSGSYAVGQYPASSTWRDV